MNPLILIQKINQANYLKEVLDLNEFKKQYRDAVKILHPDRCSLEGSVEALIKLNQLKEKHEKGPVSKDDAGTFYPVGNTIKFQGKEDLLQQSYNNFRKLKRIKTIASGHFHQYLPQAMIFDGKLKVKAKLRVLPLTNLNLPQKHVNWVLSRLLEVCAWLHQEGYVHAGINPESIFIVPETHGIVLGSFYHLRPLNARLKTISARYQHWYPSKVFDHKRATSTIDIELCKRTAAYLLGDQSGLGIKLKKTHHPAFIDFLLHRHTDTYTCFDDYRKLLDANFAKKFYPLTL